MKSTSRLGILSKPSCNCSSSIIYNNVNDSLYLVGNGWSITSVIGWEYYNATNNEWIDALFLGDTTQITSDFFSVQAYRAKYMCDGCVVYSDVYQFRHLPAISVSRNPACSSTIGLDMDVCGPGTYAGYKVDIGCSCGPTQEVIINSSPNTFFQIDFLGGDYIPNIISNSGGVLIFDHIPTTPVPFQYTPCNNEIPKSLYEIKATNFYGSNTFKFVAYEC